MSTGKNLKFRAWSKEKKSFIYSDWKYGALSFWDLVLNDFQREFEPVQRFVGRTDKTPSWASEAVEGSIDLYEGDVVDGWVSRWPDSKTRGWIEYNDHAQAFQLRYENCFNGHANEFLHRYHFFDLIGHIHQTKND